MSGAPTQTQDIDVDMGRLFSSLGRSWLRILGVALAVTALAIVGAWLATPLYRAETRILIETRESVFTRPDANGEADRPILDEEGVASQVEVIASTDILRQVARKLDLAGREEFDAASGVSLLDKVLIVAGLKSDSSEIAADERVLKAFREKLKVYRVEKSRVIVIEFSSEDPALAAAVPNAIAEAYIAVQKDAKLQSNTDATGWLQPEIDDLRRRVKEAETKVADFRSKSDLLMGGNNSVLATQQLSELSSELSRVRANRAATEAKAQGVRAALNSGASLDAVPEVLSSGLIQRLRERQVELKAQIAELSTTLLGNHPRIKSLVSQLADLDGQIRNEARKVLEGLENEAATARSAEARLTADLNTLKGESARAGGQEVELRALEREAAAQRELLESYLTRYREASSRGDRSYLPADARVFSRAVVPQEPYFPKILPIAIAAFMASLVVMAIVTLLQELFSGRAMRASPSARMQPVEQVAMPVAAVAAEPAPMAAAERRHAATDISRDEPAGERVYAAPPATAELSIVHAAEKLIATGVERAIFVSPEGDAAAATSVLVAREVADAGLRVILLDLTAAGAASRPMLESVSYVGITNLLVSEAQFTEVIHADLYSDCHVIPAGTADPALAMRAADRLPIILQSLGTVYDLVVIECGAADADNIRRLVAEGSEVLLSVVGSDDEAIAAAGDNLRAGGFDPLLQVTPAGYVPPSLPSGASAA